MLISNQAIDLMTRRLIADGQRPTTVGTFFSLGHSTYVPFLYYQAAKLNYSRIVIITSIVVAATAAAVSDRFGSFSNSVIPGAPIAVLVLNRREFGIDFLESFSDLR